MQGGAHMHVDAERRGADAFPRIPNAPQAPLPAAFPDIYLPSRPMATNQL